MGYHSLELNMTGGFVLFDVVVQIFSIFGNCLVLMAIARVRIGLAGYRRFLVSLLANDLFLSGAHIIIAIYLEMDESNDRSRTCLGTFLDSVKLFAVYGALFNLCGMSVDHFIGVLTNKKIAKAAPYVIWIAAFLLGFADIPIGGFYYYLYSYRPVNSASYIALYLALMNSTSVSTPAPQTTRPLSQIIAITSHQRHLSLSPSTTSQSPLVAPSFLNSSNHSINIIIAKASAGAKPSVWATTISPSLKPSIMPRRQYYLSSSTRATTMVSSPPSSSFPPSGSELISSLGEIDIGLLQEETDWCLVSYSYKLYVGQWFRLACTCAVFAFLLLCYGCVLHKIRNNNKSMKTIGCGITTKENNTKASTAVAENDNRNRSSSMNRHGGATSAAAAAPAAAGSSFDCRVSTASFTTVTNATIANTVAISAAVFSAGAVHNRHHAHPALYNFNRRQSTSLHRRSSKKFIKTTLLLLSVFAICWLPFIILEISANADFVMNVVTPEFMESKVHILQHIFNSVFLTYPLLDAIICVLRVDAVRRQMKVILGRCCSGNEHNSRREQCNSATPINNDVNEIVINLPNFNNDKTNDNNLDNTHRSHKLYTSGHHQHHHLQPTSAQENFILPQKAKKIKTNSANSMFVVCKLYDDKSSTGQEQNFTL